MTEDPFHSIESAQEYLRLLAAEIETVRTEVSGYVRDAVREQAARRLDALHVVDYKLKQLSHHLHLSADSERFENAPPVADYRYLSVAIASASPRRESTSATFPAGRALTIHAARRNLSLP